MKILICLFIGGLFFQTAVLAATTFSVSATIPSASGFSAAVSSVNLTTDSVAAMPAGTTALNFNHMNFSTSKHMFMPSHAFAIDFTPTAGAGNQDVSVAYTEGSNPSGASDGLGARATATFAKEMAGTVSGTTTETLLTAHGPRKRLIDVDGERISHTELAGGFLRIYVRMWTGDASDPSNGKPFTAADQPGNYTGSLVVTSVPS